MLLDGAKKSLASVLVLGSFLFLYKCPPEYTPQVLPGFLEVFVAVQRAEQWQPGVILEWQGKLVQSAQSAAGGRTEAQDRLTSPLWSAAAPGFATAMFPYGLTLHAGTWSIRLKGIFVPANRGTTPSSRQVVLDLTCSQEMRDGEAARLVAFEGAPNCQSNLPAPPVVRDMAVVDVRTSQVVSVGGSAAVVVLVKNFGAARQGFMVELADAPLTGGTAGSVSPAQTGSLNPGEQMPFRFRWNTSGASLGRHMLVASVSISNPSAESNLQNNTGFIPVMVQNRVPPVHDLAVSPLTLQDSPIMNCATIIAAQVLNQGTVTESASAKLTDSASATITGNPQTATLTPAGSPGDEKRALFNWTPTALGTHTLTASVDAVSSESDTSNNSATLTTVVNASTPAITAVNPNTVNSQSTVTLTLTGTDFGCVPQIAVEGPQSNRATISNIVRTSSTTLKFDIAVGKIGGPKALWNLILTNPDGQTARATGALTTMP